MLIISFSGKAGTGKTTAADHIISLIGGVKMSFADGVKSEVCEFISSMGLRPSIGNIYGTQSDKDGLFTCHVLEWQKSDYRPRNILNPHMEWTTDTTLSISYRKLMQLWGSEYRRKQADNYWVDKMLERIRQTPEETLIVIDDVRFPNEAKMIIGEGGLVLRVERPHRPKIDNPNHHSETALDSYQGFAATLFNGGTLEQFKGELERLMRLMR